MYWKAMLEMKVFPEKTVILEDSPVGRIVQKIVSKYNVCSE